eukprot:2464003-Pyramimonas_sp.AAC.1
MVIGATTSGAAAYVPSRTDLRMIDDAWSDMGRRVLMARLQQCSQGHPVAPSTKDVRWALKFSEAEVELRIERIRWYQVMCSTPG